MKLHSLLQTAEQEIKKIDVPSTSAAPVLTVGHNAKKRKTSHSTIKKKERKGRKRKVRSIVRKSEGLKDSVHTGCVVDHFDLPQKMENATTHLLRCGREAQDKLEARSEKCLFVGYPEESFGYLFYKPNDNVVFVARRRLFLEREMISKEESGKVVTPVEPDDISLPIRRTSSRVSKPSQFYYGFHIKEDTIIDSTLNELDEPVP
ncbi:hypothetical protein Tco_1046688 [Tanacetum coccineum]